MSRILLLVLATAIVMRAPINALGPVAQDVIETLGIDYSAYGFVAALPIFLFGLASPVVSRLLRHFSGERLFLAGLLLLIFGAWGRGAHDAILFTAGTVVMGFGITQLNVLMPAVIKTGFGGRWPAMMSAYAALIGVSGAAGVALSTPLALATGDYSMSLRIWSFAALPALILLFTLRGGFVPPEAASAPEEKRPAFSPWLVATLVVLTGLQAALNSTMSLWLPAAFTARGLTASQAGTIVTVLLLASIAGSFAVPTLTKLCPRFTPRVLATAAVFALLFLFLSRRAPTASHGPDRRLRPRGLRGGILCDARQKDGGLCKARGAFGARAVRRLSFGGRRPLPHGRGGRRLLDRGRADASCSVRAPLGALCGARRARPLNPTRKPAEMNGRPGASVL